MSKLISLYQNLKKQNEETLYLFKSGIFYIFIDNDAKKVSNLLSLKLTYLNNNTLKCGFPINSLDKYINLLNNLNYNVQIIDTQKDISYNMNEFKFLQKYIKFLQDAENIDVDSLSISKAYELISDIKQKATELLNELK